MYLPILFAVIIPRINSWYEALRQVQTLWLALRLDSDIGSSGWRPCLLCGDQYHCALVFTRLALTGGSGTTEIRKGKRRCPAATPVHALYTNSSWPQHPSRRACYGYALTWHASSTTRFSGQRWPGSSAVSATRAGRKRRPS